METAVETNRLAVRSSPRPAPALVSNGPRRHNASHAQGLFPPCVQGTACQQRQILANARQSHRGRHRHGPGADHDMPFSTYEASVRTLLSYAFIGIVLDSIAYIIHIRFRPGLKQIPGPFLASISDLDRIISCAHGRQMDHHIQLHKKYGRLVRIGANHVMFSDAAFTPQVYGISSKFMKSDVYLPFDIKTPTGMTSTVFSQRDGTAHRSIRRPIANAYALSTLKELEPMNDACSATIVRTFDGLVGQDIDLGTWSHWYAFDTIASITFSNTLSSMEQGRDIDRIIESIEGRLMYNSVLGQAP
ncbi:hypothetical protein BST61_g4815 [Cercospora zeina]